VAADEQSQSCIKTAPRSVLSLNFSMQMDRGILYWFAFLGGM
jgi:hypothetical protein